MQFNSIRFKATVFYTGILAVILAVFGTIIYVSVSHVLYSDLNSKLEVKAKEIAAILHAYEQLEKLDNHPFGYLLRAMRKNGTGIGSERAVLDNLWQEEFKLLNLKSDYINIVNANKMTVFSSSKLKGKVAGLFRGQAPFSLNNIIYKNLIGKENRLRVINYPASYQNVPLAIQIGTPLDSVISVLSRILFFIIISALALLILTSFIGSFFARSILRPVMSVSSLADKITHKGLKLRIKELQADIEMKHLVSSFNAMIGRLEKSFNHINEFSSHVAHELKTPLAIVKGEMELALDRDRDTEEYKKVFSDSLEEIDRIIKIIRDLLFLAKLDYKSDIFNFEDFDLIQFLTMIHEHSLVLSAAKNIEIKLNLPGRNVFINGDRSHLRRLFFNLISNAVKFTPSSGKIEISVSVKGAHVYVDIADNGEGIAPENLSKIFDKFYRAHKEERTPDSGTGLGLNIALSIARIHNGDIKVKSSPGQGTVFTVILPLVS